MAALGPRAPGRRAYLKCLVMKEILGTERVRVLLGDAAAFLADSPVPRFDLAVASGVLYHMADPVTLLARLAKAADRLYLFTFYYDEAVMGGRPQLAAPMVSDGKALVGSGPLRPPARQPVSSRLPDRVRRPGR